MIKENDVTPSCHSGLEPESIQRYGREFPAGQILNQVQDDSYGLLTRVAFTMAEILLSLTIIGVVAAITLPSLTGNINERTWNTQRKALYARMSQAVALMPALNSFGKLTVDASGSVTEDTVAETFVTAGLAKVLKINNICDNDHLTDCGLPTKISTLKANTMSFPKTFADLNPANTSVSADSFTKTNTKAAAFETGNGESIAVFYNPKCVSDMNETTGYYRVHDKVCANFVYDLNGSKGPNTVGKDIGIMTVLYSSDSVVVAPLPAIQLGGLGVGAGSSFISQYEASGYCRKQGDEYRMPNREESIALFTNNSLLGDYALTAWTASRSENNYYWFMRYNTGIMNLHNTTNAGTANVICIQR